MKGIVFTVFMDMVDSVFSPEMTETIIEKSDLPSGGAYTRVGTYEHNEIVQLVSALSQETRIAVPELIRTFGHFLLGQFSKLYPDFFEVCPDVLDFLEHVDSYIHVEVRMLYPDATLPQLETERVGNDGLKVLYKSSRHFGDLAEGLILGAIDHYGSATELFREDLEEGDTQCVQFNLRMISSQAA